MPGFDATGSWGRGPGTGWGLGPCGAGQRRGLVRFGGRGFDRGAFGGRGRGPGWGFWGRPRWGYGSWGFGPFGPGAGFPAAAPQDEAPALKKEEAYLKGELEAVQKRLAELEGSQ